jgi:hypothetical protein
MFTFKPFSTHRLRKLFKIAQPRPGQPIGLQSGTAPAGTSARFQRTFDSSAFDAEHESSVASET